jgi:phosphoglycolate phosphatase-like HAD superfamily hydrolase
MDKYDAVFFDFDGVIADSVEVKTQAFSGMFEQYGHDIQQKVIEHHRKNGGMSRFDKFYYYYKTYIGQELDKLNHRKLCEEFASRVVDSVVAAPEIEGAKAFIKKCQQHFPCFIISATPEEEIRLIAKRRKIDHYFFDIYGAPKEKHVNINTVLRQYGYNPEKCIFFGDAESDYKAALKTNLQFVAILPHEKAPLLKIAPHIQWHKNFTTLTL